MADRQEQFEKWREEQEGYPLPRAGRCAEAAWKESEKRTEEACCRRMCAGCRDGVPVQVLADHPLLPVKKWRHTNGQLCAASPIREGMEGKNG